MSNSFISTNEIQQNFVKLTEHLNMLLYLNWYDSACFLTVTWYDIIDVLNNINYYIYINLFIKKCYVRIFHCIPNFKLLKHISKNYTESWKFQFFIVHQVKRQLVECNFMARGTIRKIYVWNELRIYQINTGNFLYFRSLFVTIIFISRH